MAVNRDDLVRGSTPPPWISWPGMEIWERVFALGGRREWPAKSVLYRYGDRADELTLILDGIVGIEALGMSGAARNIGNLGPGGILGEAAFFTNGIYRHGIRCIVPCAGITFSREAVLDRILPEHPDLALYLFRNLAATSYMMSAQLEAMSFMSVEQQLAHFLWHLWEEQERGSRIYRDIAAISLGQLGEMLGMHRVTVTRLMGGLKRDGVVSMTPRIRVEEPGELERIFNRG